MKLHSPKKQWCVTTWDILFWITVIFPFVTGGLWLNEPGLHIELSQINAQVFGLGALAFLLHLYFRQDITQASSVTLLLRFWNWWCQQVMEHTNRTLWGSVCILTIFWSGAAISRHAGFQSGAADMGIFTNAMWNVVQGNGFISSLKSGANMLTDHQSPSFLLLSPLFYLFPRPETLLVSQAFGILSGGIALFYIGKQYSTKTNPLIYVLPFLYWFYFPLRNVNRFDFHPEVFMLPFFLFAIWGLQSPKFFPRLVGMLFFIFGLGAKETAGPVAAGICLAWLCGAAPPESRRFTRILSSILLPLSIALFAFNTTMVPKFFGRTYRYYNSYEHIGSGILNIVLAPLTKPDVFFYNLVRGNRIKVFLSSIAPLLFLPLLGWRMFLASIPGYLMLLLSDGSHRISLGYHYSIEFSVGLFWALPLALERIRNPFMLPWLSRGSVKKSTKIIWKKLHLKWLSPPILLSLLMIFLFGNYGRSDFYYIRNYPLTPHQRWLKKELFSCLSPLSLSVPDPMAPHLALRNWVHFIPILELGIGSPHTVACVITDEEFTKGPREKEDLIHKLARLKYYESYSCNGLKIYQSTADNLRCLRCVPNCPK